MSKKERNNIAFMLWRCSENHKGRGGEVMSKDPAFLFYPESWYTPNTYDNHFQNPTQKSGVYLLVYPLWFDQYKKKDLPVNNDQYDILYVGSAKNLYQRYQKHEVLRILRETYGYIQFYFKEYTNYKEIEKQLIKQIQPRYNKQWR